MNRQQWNGRKKKSFRLSPRAGRIVLALAFTALLVFSVAGFAGYIRDRNAARDTAENMRGIYDAAETESPDAGYTPEPPAETSQPAETPAVPPEETVLPAETAAPAAGSEPAQNPERLEPVPYPNNPRAEVSARFLALRQENRDIAGWLTIGAMLDEPVVQRDNEYYMDHDAAGQPNVNGAVFLDAIVSLKTKPASLILYGHNMRSGAMFGCLRNYENSSFYHNDPFITFDSLYEEGRYVVFSVCTVSVEEGRPNYLDFFALSSAYVAERLQAIETLQALSVHTCTLDVQPEDQLLILVTCVDRDDERRLVAARRIRDGETEKELRELVRKSRPSAR